MTLIAASGRIFCMLIALIALVGSIVGSMYQVLCYMLRFAEI